MGFEHTLKLFIIINNLIIVKKLKRKI